MKKTFQFGAVMALALALFCTTLASAQTPARPPQSPNDSVSGMIGKAMVKIKYGAPSLRGRKILGAIEPYGKPWRAGANAATTIITDKDLVIGGKTLAAGKYTIYMVPGEKKWKVNINSATGQWGIAKDTKDPRGYSATDDPSKDVATVTVKPKKAGPTERLTYTINSKGFTLMWEDLEIDVPVKG